MHRMIGKLCKISEDSPVYKIEKYSPITNQYLLQIWGLPKEDFLLFGWINVGICQIQQESRF